MSQVVHKVIDAAVAVGVAEAIPHGFAVVPDAFFCSNDCGANITESATPPDAVNVFVANGGVGAELATVVIFLD